MDKALERLAHLNERKLRTTSFSNMVLLAIHGRFWSFRFHCLLSALLFGSNMCTQVSPLVSKLVVTRLLQPLYGFKSFPGTFKALCLLLLGEQMRYAPSANLSQVQTLFQNCLHTAFWYASTTSYIFDNRASCSTTIFTTAMLALVTGLPGRVSSLTENFAALKALTHLKTVRIEMVWGPYIPHNSLNICFESLNAAFNIATNISLLVHVPM